MTKPIVAFGHPERIRTPYGAITALTAVRKAIAQARDIVRWPELAASFQEDERRLLQVMHDRGWPIPADRVFKRGRVMR